LVHHPLTASVLDTPELSRSLLRQYTGIACELTVTVAAHWNYPPNPYQSPSLIWSHWSSLHYLLTSSRRPTTMTGSSRWNLLWRRKDFWCCVWLWTSYQPPMLLMMKKESEGPVWKRRTFHHLEESYLNSPYACFWEFYSICVWIFPSFTFFTFLYFYFISPPFPILHFHFLCSFLVVTLHSLRRSVGILLAVTLLSRLRNHSLSDNVS